LCWDALGSLVRLFGGCGLSTLAERLPGCRWGAVHTRGAAGSVFDNADGARPYECAPKREGQAYPLPLSESLRFLGKPLADVRLIGIDSGKRSFFLHTQVPFGTPWCKKTTRIHLCIRASGQMPGFG
jgi:hypothetical protein